ncbi:DUF3950 domain-containing protein [Escherichia coli]
MRFPNQMIEQINIALRAEKGLGCAWVIEACCQRLT